MPHASRHTLRRSMTSSWRLAPALLGTFVGIDLRRPASWIALAMGGWLGWCASRIGAGGEGVVPASALLTVAAIGDLPLVVCRPVGRGQVLLWACERAAWPLAGVMLGAWAAGGGWDAFGTATLATAGTLLAAITACASRLSNAKAADAASLTLLLAAASAAIGEWFASRLGGNGFGATAAWLLLGGLGWTWWRSQGAAGEAFVTEPHRAGRVAGVDVLQADALPASGPLRQTLTRMAMVAALAAMTGWLMFDPGFDSASGGENADLGHRHAAVAWALFTAAWFVSLAVPQATLQDGVAGAVAWERLLRTAAHVRRGAAGWRSGIASPRPGFVRFAGGVALTQAAILGWPVLVCVVLSLPAKASAAPPLGIVIGLAVAAVVVPGIVWLGAIGRVSRETTFAVTLAVALACFAGLLAVATGSTFPSREPPRSHSPILPSLVSRRMQRPDGGWLGNSVLPETRSA